MKIAQVADIHIQDNRIQEFEIMIPQLIESINSYNPDVTAFCGDMFIHRDRLSPKQVELCRMFYHKLNSKVISVPGNHGISMSELKIDSLSAIFKYAAEFPIYTEVGSYFDFYHLSQTYRFHFYSYPSKKELRRLKISEFSELYNNKEIDEVFEKNMLREPNCKNILIFHGVLDGFNMNTDYKASAEMITAGKDVVISKNLWGKFDAVMAGHLHSYQAIDKAVYTGCPFPLNYADSNETGWVLWEDTGGVLEPKFIKLEQKYPFITLDTGELRYYGDKATDEAKKRLQNDLDYTNCRVRIKYKIYASQSGDVKHAELSRLFKNAKDIKIVPQYMESPGEKASQKISIEDFQHHNIIGLINKYIDDNKFNPKVKDIAATIETKLKIEDKDSMDDKGISFKPFKLNLKNFKCFGSGAPEIRFDQLEKTVGVFGPNWTGKSALVESILWNLYGQTLRNKDLKSVIRNGKDEAEVVMEFHSNSVFYMIKRNRSKSKGSLNLYKLIEQEWKDISGADVKATQQYIEKLVGSMEVFVSTVFSSQNNISRLLDKKATDRKEIILDCLQIDVLDKRQKEILKLKKDKKETLSREQGKLETLKVQQTNLIRSNPQELINEFSEQLEKEKIQREKFLTHLNALSVRSYKYDELKKELDGIAEKLVTKRTKIAETKSKIEAKIKEKDILEGYMSDKSIIDQGLDRLNKYQDDMSMYSTEQKKLFERRSSKAQLESSVLDSSKYYNSQINILRKNHDDLISQIQSLKTINCSKDDCPINTKTEKHRKDLRIKVDEIDEQITNLIKEREIKSSGIKEKIIAIENEISQSFYDGALHTGAIRMHKEEEQKKWPELKHKMASGENIIASMLELIEAYKSQKYSTEVERDELVVKRTDISNEIASVEEYKREVEKTRIDVTTSNKSIENYQDRITRYTKDIETIKELDTQLSSQSKKIGNMSDYINYCSKYQDIVSKTGVIYSLVDKSLPIIEKFCQELLSKTTNGTLSIEIESFKMLSKGNKSEEVMIYLVDSKGRRDASEGSGAETMLISLALRAAMSHLLSLRMGGKVELFIVDEGLGVLDEESILIAKEMFKELGEIFNQVFFITHVGEMKDIAKSVIMLESNGFESTFTITK